MDIRTELNELNTSEDLGASLINNLVKQREDLLKKIHILKARDIANDLEDNTSIDFFKNLDVYYLRIDLRKEYGNKYRIVLCSLDKNQQKEYSFVFEESEKFLRKLAENFKEFSNEFVNDFLKQKLHTIHKLEKGIGDSFLNQVLSDELKTIYANMGKDNVSLKVLNEQQEILSQKIYLLKVQSIANQIEEKQLNGFFGNNSNFIGMIYEQGGDKAPEIISGLLDINGMQLASITDSDKYMFLHRIFREIDGFSIDFISDNLKANMRKYNPNRYENNFIDKVKIESGISEELLNLLLSKELKSILDYNNLQLELGTNTSINKRLKM